MKVHGLVFHDGRIDCSNVSALMADSNSGDTKVRVDSHNSNHRPSSHSAMLHKILCQLFESIKKYTF